MIVYFDTSALIPLLVEEPGSQAAGRLWDAADRVVSVRLVYAEARAALAQAQRLGRITAKNLSAINDELEDLYAQIDQMDVDDALVRRAGDLAQHHGLRGSDAIHLAEAERLDDHEVVFAAGDAQLLQAATGLGIAVSATTAST